MPDYQKAAVTSFFKNHPPPFTAAQFNNSQKVGELSSPWDSDTDLVDCRQEAILTWLRMGEGKDIFCILGMDLDIFCFLLARTTSSGYSIFSAFNRLRLLTALQIDGEFALVFGTSCSSPVVGSLITAINDARLAIGKGPVGFINPAVS